MTITSDALPPIIYDWVWLWAVGLVPIGFGIVEIRAMYLDWVRHGR